jgi:hypothetical protein
MTFWFDNHTNCAKKFDIEYAIVDSCFITNDNEGLSLIRTAKEDVKHSKEEKKIYEQLASKPVEIEYKSTTFEVSSFMLNGVLSLNSDTYQETVKYINKEAKIIHKFLCIPMGDIVDIYKHLFKLFGEAVLFKLNSASSGVEIYHKFEDVVTNLDKLKHSFS